MEAMLYAPRAAQFLFKPNCTLDHKAFKEFVIVKNCKCTTTLMGIRHFYHSAPDRLRYALGVYQDSVFDNSAVFMVLHSHQGLNKLKLGHTFR